MESRRIAGLLADPDRRRVVAALILVDGQANLETLAAKASLSLRAAADAVDRLVAGGLVESPAGPAGDHVLVESAFGQAARAEADSPAPPSEVFADHPDDHARILAGAVVDGRIVALPAKRSKRLVVLDYLAQNFDIGVRYREAEVNVILSRFDDDVAALRRYLVDERYLDRSGGEYWRCGGTV